MRGLGVVGVWLVLDNWDTTYNIGCFLDWLMQKAFSFEYACMCERAVWGKLAADRGGC